MPSKESWLSRIFPTLTLGTFNTLGAFNNATAIGMSNTVSRTRATAIGVGAYAPSYGELAFANGWKATVGDSQIRMCIQRRSVAFINTNWFNLYNDSAAEGFNLQNSGLYAITARVVGKNSSTTKLFDYELKGLVKRAAGTATEIYPAVVTTNYSSVATIELGLDVSAGTAIYLRCRDTAAGGDTIYWVAKLEAVELVY